MNMEAYLVEARSLGGLSGSPVFISQSVNWPVPKVTENRYSPDYGQMRGAWAFLGMMHGHWEIKPSDLNAAYPELVGKDKGVNIGVAIVTPAEKVLEILQSPKVTADRKAWLTQQMEKGWNDAPRPVKDSEPADG